MHSTGLRVLSCAALERGTRCSALGLKGARRARCTIDAVKKQLHNHPRPWAHHLKMEISLEESFPLPNLNDIDLSELSCDETPSPTSSTDYSPLSSPTSLDNPLDSPMSTSSNGSLQPSNGSTDLSPPDKPPSCSSKKNSKHRAKCSTSQCIKKEHISILRRNERERNRVKLVSDGFATLRKHVPTTPVNKKLSKVDTLRTAIEYIRHLQKVLNESNRIERERRLMRQVGWFQEAYKLQAHSGMSVLQQNQINSLLMELPDIVPYPSTVQVRSSPMGYNSYFSSMSLNQ